MAKKAKTTDRKPSPKGGDDKSAERTKVLKELGENASSIVQRAASILEEEIALGIAAASKVERSVREGGNVSAEQFNEVAQRLRKDAHDIVNIIGEQVNGLQAGKSDELSKRFQNDAHDAVDLMVNLVNIAPDIINRLLRSQNSDKKTDKPKVSPSKQKK